MISAILATDMAEHFNICKEMASIENFEDIAPNEPKLLKYVTHTSDLAGQVRRNISAIRWQAESFYDTLPLDILLFLLLE